jgi:hypothetical protein
MMSVDESVSCVDGTSRVERLVQDPLHSTRCDPGADAWCGPYPIDDVWR